MQNEKYERRENKCRSERRNKEMEKIGEKIGGKHLMAKH